MINKSISLVLLLIMLEIEGKCQVPQAINYQAVARNSSGSVISGKLITARISIIQNSISGVTIYQETQNAVTDNSGIFSIKIGMGTAIVGLFSMIDWSAANNYIKSEFDFNDGSGFQLSGTSQILSVPYAFHAKTAANWKVASKGVNWSKSRLWEGDSTKFNLDGYSQIVSVHNNTLGYPISTYNVDPAGMSAIAHWVDEGQGWLLSGINGVNAVGASWGISNAKLANIISRGGDFVLGPVGTNNNLHLLAGGSPRLVVHSNGNVGIGIGVNPPTNALTVNGVVESLTGGIKYPDGTVQTSASTSPWNFLNGDPNLLGISYTDGKTGQYEFSNGNSTPGGVMVGLTIKNTKNTIGSQSFLDLVSSSSTSFANRSYISLRNPTGSYSLECRDSTLIVFKWKGTPTNGSGTPVLQYRSDLGHIFKGSITSDALKVGTPQSLSVTGAKVSAFGGGVFTDRFIEIDDANANSHINLYENDVANPIFYKRYFYGQYGDLVIQGTSKTYTGNIHFVTGSTAIGADSPTQRMVIMGNGNVGIGNYALTSAPKSKLQIQNGDIYLENIGSGLIIKSPNGQCWRVTIDNTGNLLRTSIACP